MNISTSDFVKILKQIQKDDIDTFIKKNSDYGDSFRDFGNLGIMI